MPKISVIVPIYNVEKLLGRCLDSIVNQSLKDIEILLVNDGSIDKSGTICDEYAEKDFRIKVFHIKNGGVSAARNLGLDNATGDWVSLIDSDDWVKPNYLKDLYEATSDDVGIVISFLRRIGVNGELLWGGRGRKEKISVLEYIKTRSLVKAACGKLYRRSIIEKYKIRFSSKTSIGEDAIFIYEIMQKINYIQFLDRDDYMYIVQGNSLVRRKHKFDTYYSILYKELKSSYNKLSNCELSNYCKEDLISLLRKALRAMYTKPYKLSAKERMQKLKTIYKEENDIIEKMSKRSILSLLKNHIFLLDKSLLVLFFLNEGIFAKPIKLLRKLLK